MSYYSLQSSASAPGGASIDFIDLQTGVSPIAPVGNTIQFNGAVVAAGTNPVQTDGTAGDTMALEVQLTQAIPATNIANVGLAAFDSAFFAVDASGFVTFTGTGTTETLTGDTGGAVGPVLGNINLFSAVVAAGTTPISVDGAGNTETIHLQISQAVSAADATRIGLSNFDSTDFTVDADGFVQIKGSSNATTTTIGAVTADLLTIPLGAVPGVYQFEARVAAFDSATPSGAGYNVYGTFRTDGLAATLVGNQDIYNEEATLMTADAYFTASGNDAILRVLGVVALTIDWAGESKLTFAS